MSWGSADLVPITYQLRQNLREGAADNSARVGVKGIQPIPPSFCQSLASHV
jgi:hypothetical protein